MAKLSKWLKACWDASGDRVVWFFKLGKEMKKKLKKSHQHEPPPQKRRQSLSLCHLEAEQRIPCIQESRLLNLPAEIRLLIWEQAFTGNWIGLYRDHKCLTHCLLDDTNTEDSTQDIPLSVETIREAVIAKYGHPDQQPDPKRLSVIPLLQSCRMIYSEAIEMLYTGNTFVFLQNQTCWNFLAEVVPERLASIRSIHWHWQVRETSGRSKNRWSKGQSLWLLDRQNFPQLEHISLFIQGPMSEKWTYHWILSDLKIENFSSAETAVLRLPNQEMDRHLGYYHSQGVDEMIEGSDTPFTIVRPSRAEFQDAEDHDVGIDCGWRCGTMFLPQYKKDGGAPGFVTKSYLVWTPMPPGSSWPYFAYSYRF